MVWKYFPNLEKEICNFFISDILLIQIGHIEEFCVATNNFKYMTNLKNQKNCRGVTFSGSSVSASCCGRFQSELVAWSYIASDFILFGASQVSDVLRFPTCSLHSPLHVHDVVVSNFTHPLFWICGAAPPLVGYCQARCEPCANITQFDQVVNSHSVMGGALTATPSSRYLTINSALYRGPAFSR